MTAAPAISVIIPCFNEAESIPELVARIEAALDREAGRAAPKNYEIIIVDDGSTDATWQVAQQLSRARPCVRAFSLRRNFGKSMALSVGFRKARAPIILTLDADLQDPPEHIGSFLERLRDNWDVVSGRRVRRSDTLMRRIGSSLFNWAVRHTTGLKLNDINCGMKGYRREVFKLIAVYGQFHRYIPLLAHLNGFRVTEVDIENAPRRYGLSKFPTMRYEGLFDLLTILFTYNYRLRPLHFFAKLSLLLLVPGIGIVLYLLIGYFAWLLSGGSGISILFARPLLFFSLTMIVVGMNVFLAGFVCDFLLYHLMPERFSKMVDLSVRSVAAPEASHDAGEEDTLTPLVAAAHGSIPDSRPATLPRGR